MGRVLWYAVIAVEAVRVFFQSDPVPVRPQHGRVASSQAGHGHAVFPVEAYLVPQFDVRRADDLAVARSALAAQVLLEASSRRVVVGWYSVLRQRGHQSGRLVRRLVTRDACMAWHLLHIHLVPLPDGPEAGPNLIRELLGLLGGPLRQAPQRGLGVRVDSDASDRVRRGGDDAFQVFARLVESVQFGEVSRRETVRCGLDSRLLPAPAPDDDSSAAVLRAGRRRPVRECSDVGGW